MSDAIAEYFAQYPSYSYVPGPDWRQIGAFNALAKELKWGQDERKRQFEVFKVTWTEVVEREFEDSSLEHYQTLCGDLNMYPIPDTVAECKAELKGVYVNIVDLVQYRKDRKAGRRYTRPRQFRNLKELSDYSNDEKKWYPVESAKAEMLKELLKVLR